MTNLLYMRDSKNNLTFHESKKKGGEKVEQPKNIGLVTAGKTYRAAKRQARKTYKEIKAQAKIVRVNTEKRALDVYNAALKTNGTKKINGAGKPVNNTKKINGTGHTNKVGAKFAVVGNAVKAV